MADEAVSGGGAPDAGAGQPTGGQGGAPGGGAPAAAADPGAWIPEGYSSREEFEGDWKKFGGKEKISRYQEVHDHFNSLADMPEIGDVVKGLYERGRLPDGYGRLPPQQKQPEAKRERYRYFDENSHPEARQRFWDETLGNDPGQLTIQGVKNDPDVQEAIWELVANRLGQNPTMGKIQQAAFRTTYQQQIQSLHPNVAKWFNAGPMTEERLREAMQLSQGFGNGAPQQQGPPAAAVNQQAQQAARVAGGNRVAGGAPAGARPAPKKGAKASAYLRRQ